MKHKKQFLKRYSLNACLVAVVDWVATLPVVILGDSAPSPIFTSWLRRMLRNNLMPGWKWNFAIRAVPLAAHFPPVFLQFFQPGDTPVAIDTSFCLCVEPIDESLARDDRCPATAMSDRSAVVAKTMLRAIKDP